MAASGGDRAAPLSVLFAYWGRRGAGPTLTEAMVRAAQRDPALAAEVSFSRQGERAKDLAALTSHPLAIDTFESGAGALAASLRLPTLHGALAREIRSRGIGWVVTVMPHLWGRMLAGATHKAGARYAVIVHDAAAHPGEESWLLDQAARAEIRAADLVISCSDHVTRQLTARHGPLPIATLFHPPFDFGATTPKAARTAPHTPARLLFFGRILPYKGLGLLLDAHRRLQSDGIACELAIVGDGSVDGLNLSAPGVTLVNRWIEESEIPGFLSEADILVAPYLEASQSGVIAAAQAAGLPVVATPVGGLTEQVIHGETGLIADAVSPSAVAAAIADLTNRPGLYGHCSAGALAQAKERGWPKFIQDLKKILSTH